MEYYRTKEDIIKLMFEFKSEYSSRSDYKKIISKKHNMTHFGLFKSVIRDIVYLGGGSDQPIVNQFKVSDEVLDYFINSGIFDDRINNKKLVMIFGRLEKGRIIDVVAIDFQNLYTPSDISKS